MDWLWLAEWSLLISEDAGSNRVICNLPKLLKDEGNEKDVILYTYWNFHRLRR